MQDRPWRGVSSGAVPRAVLSFLLWSLVVDEIIRGENGCYTLGYADDIAILISRKFPNTIPELLQEALGAVQQWGDRT